MFQEDYTARRSFLEHFEKSLQLYYEGRFQEALDGFSKIADQDKPAHAYLQRCRQFLECPPVSWDGVWKLAEK